MLHRTLERRKKHLNVAVAWCGVGIAVVGVLALLSWGEAAPTPPPRLTLAHGQLPNRAAAPAAENVPPALPVGRPLPDQSGSARQPSSLEVAGSSPVGYANRDDDQAAVRDAANSENAIASAARPIASPALGARRALWSGRARRKPDLAWRHPTAVRVAAAKKRFWRRHWQARATINGERCFFFICLPWRAQPVSYEPPRNVTQ